MNSKYLWIIILTALIIVGLYHTFAVGRFNYPEFRLKAGQVSETEGIAPFDFPIMKNPELLINEPEESVENILTPYRISDEQLFSALSVIDQLWAIFYDDPTLSPVQKAEAATKAGFKLDTAALVFAYGNENLDRSYDRIRAGLQEIYKRGIYAESPGDSILIFNGKSRSSKPLSTYLNRDEALLELIGAYPEAELLLAALAESLVLPNIVIDEEHLAELKQKTISEIPETEGIVLQNEVIVLKNARVTERDIEKLESLQVAFRSRNLQKSPLQQMLLALGMMIYTFLILLVANHYYGVFHKSSGHSVADYLPVNLGFILIVLLGIFTNHIFTLSNLVIPFALTVLAAAI